VRYADDAVMLFEYEEDARRVMAVLPKRFGKYGLTLHPDKTRLVAFGRPDRMPLTRGGDDGPDEPGTFDFPRLHHPLGQEPHDGQVGGEDANRSRPLPTNAEENLAVVQGESPCTARDAAAGPEPEAPRPLRLLRPQGQPGAALGSAALGRAAVVALVAPPLTARPLLGGDEPAAAALPAADAGSRIPA
jgi:hypothetical protein